MTTPKSQPGHCVHPPETFTIPYGGEYDRAWTVDPDGSPGVWQLTCHHCREVFEYSIRDDLDTGERYDLFGSDRACPNPQKIGYATEGEALADASLKGELHNSTFGVYLCQCDTWHLTTLWRGPRSR